MTPATDRGGRRWAIRLGALAAILTAGLPFAGFLALPFGWLALSTGAIAIAYARHTPEVFGKTAERGGISPLRAAPLLPFLGLTFFGWWLAVRFGRSPVWAQVAPDLWLGRWPRRGEVPAEVEQVIDLTAEMPCPPDREGRHYLLLPTLDGTGPDPGATRRLLDALAIRPTYIHCAMGHGRSATLAAVVLVRWGRFATFDEAVAHLQHLRPGVSIKPGQRAVALEILGEA